ncbi:YcnI family protein [Paenibacillus sp. FA6]|uniref:YcnI family copper-binding membrane protein n=1 Tax=Paenibacillus sp. FA6 TaxID=3413029 RepID=UPI003F6597B8
MFKKSKLSILFISAVASSMLFAGIASAHVTVKPTTSTPGAWETYTIKIPVEKDIPTTKVSLKIPAEVDFKQYQPAPDWQTSTEKDATGKVSSITWTATGEGISAGEFQTFNFVAVNPKEDASIAWDAYQYYSDGSIVEWTGEEGSDLPHTITLITSASSSEEADDNAAHDHDHSTTAPATPSEVDQEPTNTSDTSSSNSTSSTSAMDITTLVISIVALFISIIALLRALRNKKI